MKSYKRLDANRPLTFNELSQKIPFLKKKLWGKILEEIISEKPELQEEAMYMNKVVIFYSPDIIALMGEKSREFTDAKLKHEKQMIENSPASKFKRILGTSI